MDETISVSEFYLHWLEEIKRPHLKHDSYLSYRNCVYNYIMPYWKGKTICQIDQKSVETLLFVTAERSYSVARNLKALLTTSMKYALENHFISTDPSIGIRLKRKKAVLSGRQQAVYSQWQMSFCFCIGCQTALAATCPRFSSGRFMKSKIYSLGK